MIRQKNANMPEWTEIYTYSELPKELARLEELAHNLWWSWTPDAKILFKHVDRKLWQETEGNPVMLIRKLTPERIDEVRSDEALLRELDAVYEQYQQYMSQPQDEARPSVAYFSMEYGLSNVLKIYSGGLGVLAGDYLKEASDSNVRLTAVGFLYRHGYFTQTLGSDGQQIANYPDQDFTQLPICQVLNADGTPLIHEVPYNGYNVYCHVWEVKVGRIKLYLMDTDLMLNSEWDRSITSQLYGGDWENRMKQEYLLGMGGVMLLERLGIKKDVYHMNEGHAALMNAQRLLGYVEREGFDFDTALELVRASSLYTVHTPVPAGHDYFDEDLIGKYMGHIPQKLGISWQEFMDMGRENPGSNEKFSMSVFALNTCGEANGVSYLHGAVSRKMFAPVWKGFLPEELHVGYVTNGVHLPSWATTEWQTLYKKHLGEDYLEHQTEEALWSKLQSLPSGEIWETHQRRKNKLAVYIRSHYGDQWMRSNEHPEVTKAVLDGLNPEALWIGFGRRFATYKRAHLLFTDLDRLSRIVNNPERPVIFLFTGKAHPADGAGQGLIKYILEISRRPEFVGKIIFLENYDMRLASKLISGVDVWMNTPTRPLEASGTSGEKAEMNGVLNLSVLDGWWYEGYHEGAGWALTDKRTFRDQSKQDKLDAATIYDLIEREVAPLFYKRNEAGVPEGWVGYMKNSMNFIAPHYTMRRMLDDYYEKFYNKLAARSQRTSKNGAALAKEIVNWKRETAEHWDELKILSVSESNGGNPNIRTTDSRTSVKLVLDRGSLQTKLSVALVAISVTEDGEEHLERIHELRLVHKEGSVETYLLEEVRPEPGHYKVALRVVAESDLLPYKMDFAYLRWVALS